jgi:hypothetical protein
MMRPKIGWVILCFDNISSNNTCVCGLLKTLRSDLDPKQGCLRCFDHVVDFATRALLFGKEVKDQAAWEVVGERKCQIDPRRVRPLGLVGWNGCRSLLRRLRTTRTQVCPQQ